VGRKGWRRRWRYLLVVPGLLGVLVGVSVVGAAVSPGNISFEAKWADWLRANHAGWLAKQFEQMYYSLKAPPKGGRPKGLNKVPGTVAVGPVGTSSEPSASPGSSGRTSSPASSAAPGTKTTTPVTPTSRPTATTAPVTSTAQAPTTTAQAPTTTAQAPTTTAQAPTTTAQAPTTTARPGLAPPSPVPLVVQPALPGEGKWQPTGPLVHGVPAMYVAQFRADKIYTSEITSAVWMDPKLLRFELVPGQLEPGGKWAHPPYVTAAELPYLVAAFNGGFLFSNAKGGIYMEGKVGVPLVKGAASFVIYKDGQVNVGSWGTQVKMGPGVAAVLQNLVLLVNNGHIAPSATYTDNAIWGYTLGGGAVVPRSGVGVTADGALVYVAGPALTAKTLAESLLRAGAVRAMTLDMNPYWVTFNFYSHVPGHPSEVTGSKLYPQMERSADRYLPPVLEARDFFEVLLPGAPTSG
jgi:hypothetical protein